MILHRALVTVTVMTGCSSPPSSPAPASSLPDANLCGQTWKTLPLAEATDLFQPGAMLWHNHALYFASDVKFTKDPSVALLPGPLIAAVDDTGGSVRPIAADYAQQLWTDGDTLQYAKHDELWSVPFEGGTPTRIVAGGTSSAASPIGSQFLNNGYLYWLNSPPNNSEAWRVPLSGGPAEKIGSFGAWADEMWLIDQKLVATSTHDNLLVLPISGGVAQALHANGRFMGFDARGAYFSPGEPTTPPPYRVNVDDGTTTTLTALPQGIFFTNIVAFDGGWLLSASERFSDGKSRVSAWTVDANYQNAKRVSCEPEAITDEGSLVFTMLSSPDAFFLRLARVEVAGDAWSIVRIDRSSL